MYLLKVRYQRLGKRWKAETEMGPCSAARHQVPDTSARSGDLTLWRSHAKALRAMHGFQRSLYH